MGPDPKNWVDAICRELNITPLHFAKEVGVPSHAVDNWRWGGAAEGPNRAKLLVFAEKYRVTHLLPINLLMRHEDIPADEMLEQASRNAYSLIGASGTPPFDLEKILQIHAFLRMHFFEIASKSARNIALGHEELKKLVSHAAELLKKKGLNSTPRGSHLTSSFLESKPRPHAPFKPARLVHMSRQANAPAKNILYPQGK